VETDFAFRGLGSKFRGNLADLQRHDVLLASGYFTRIATFNVIDLAIYIEASLPRNRSQLRAGLHSSGRGRPRTQAPRARIMCGGAEGHLYKSQIDTLNVANALKYPEATRTVMALQIGEIP